MYKYEYKLLSEKKDIFDKLLNELQKDGWYNYNNLVVSVIDNEMWYTVLLMKTTKIE